MSLSQTSFLNNPSVLLEINEKQQILVHVARGKFYIKTPSKYKDQLPQKGETCWYYAPKLDPAFKTRFGKDFPPSLPERKLEMEISNYRKAMTSIDNKYHELQVFINRVRKESIELDKEFIEFYLQSQKKLSDTIKEMAKQFLTQKTFHDFSQFSKNKLNQTRIQHHITILKNLGYDPDEVFIDFSYKTAKANPHCDPSVLEITIFRKEIQSCKNKLSTETIAFTYAHAVHQKINEKCEYTPSPWKPTDSIEVFMNVLRTLGSCIVGGKFGQAYYTKQPHRLNEQFGEREIVGWNPTERKENSCSHQILVIGAQKKDKNEYIYYLDPYDGNFTNQTGRLYKISYERFRNSVNNIICKPYSEKTAHLIPTAIFHRCQPSNRAVQADDVQLDKTINEIQASRIK